MGAAGGGRTGKWGVGSTWGGFHFRKMSRVLETGCTTDWLYLKLLNRTLKNGQDGKVYVTYVSLL